jgi:hypothetical protein
VDEVLGIDGDKAAKPSKGALPAVDYNAWENACDRIIVWQTVDRMLTASHESNRQPNKHYKKNLKSLYGRHL